MIMEEPIENTRMLNELALASGRKRKSPQTGFLHYCYNPVDQEPHLTIPPVENFLFALALLRSRTIENVQEAKAILEKLLAFQNRCENDPVYGNFPLYLHEYPACKDRFTGLHCASAIVLILKCFHQVIGQDLKNRLEEALILSIKQAFSAYSEKKAGYPNAVKIACTAIAAGRITQERSLEEQGYKLLEQLRDHPDLACWFCPSSLGSLTVSLLMVYPQLNDSPWSHFWDHLQTTWHLTTASYAGPGIKEWQEGQEPQVTLYDLVCGYFCGAFSARALKESPVHLEAMLIPTSGERFNAPSYPIDREGIFNGAKWKIHQEEHFAYSYIEKNALEQDSVYWKGFHPLKLLWGNRENVHTFVNQGGNASSITFNTATSALNDIDLVYELEGRAELEDREASREIQLFISNHEDLDFLISSQKASTFTLEDSLIIKDNFLTLMMTLTQEDGTGRFLGHRMLGNRPSQLSHKGNDRFSAYDWQLFLRTISREENSRIRIKLNIETNA